MYLMLQKGISKGKLLDDLTMLMKRGKLAGTAAMYNLIFHNHSGDRHLSEYNKTPAYPVFQSNNKRNNTKQYSEEVLMGSALQMLNSATASLALPGFGQTPFVRQLRITASPFPLRNDDADCQVDEAAEEFILRFYKDLRRQNDTWDIQNCEPNTLYFSIRHKLRTLIFSVLNMVHAASGK